LVFLSIPHADVVTHSSCHGALSHGYRRLLARMLRRLSSRMTSSRSFSSHASSVLARILHQRATSQTAFLPVDLAARCHLPAETSSKLRYNIEKRAAGQSAHCPGLGTCFSIIADVPTRPTRARPISTSARQPLHACSNTPEVRRLQLRATRRAPRGPSRSLWGQSICRLEAGLAEATSVRQTAPTVPWLAVSRATQMTVLHRCWRISQTHAGIRKAPPLPVVMSQQRRLRNLRGPGFDRWDADQVTMKSAMPPHSPKQRPFPYGVAVEGPVAGGFSDPNGGLWDIHPWPDSTPAAEPTFPSQSAATAIIAGPKRPEASHPARFGHRRWSQENPPDPETTQLQRQPQETIQLP
jgi:hypothetical protein